MFRTAPSEAEYKRLLGAMPESGAADVRDAVNYFNAYAEKIGARPFDGRSDKPKQALTPASAFRERALSAIQ
jgi:hypothetical protein